MTTKKAAPVKPAVRYYGILCLHCCASIKARINVRGEASAKCEDCGTQPVEYVVKSLKRIHSVTLR